MVVAYLGGTTQDRLKELRLLAIHPPTHILSEKGCMYLAKTVDFGQCNPRTSDTKRQVGSAFLCFSTSFPSNVGLLQRMAVHIHPKEPAFFFIYCSHIFVGCPFLGMCQHCSSLRVICGTPLHAFRAMALRSFWSVQTSSFVPFRKQICAEPYLEFFRTASFHFTYFPFFRIKCFQKQDGSI